MNKRELYERTSEEYLLLNSCGIQRFFETGGRANRAFGRVDYHILYVAEGTCHVTTDGKTEKAPAGSLILYRPEEKQEYAYLPKERSVSYYVHFTGAGCEDILKKLGFSHQRILYMGKNAVFEKIFERMQREREMNLTYAEPLASALLAELLSVAARAIDMRKKGFAISSEERITMACRTIYEKLGTVSIRELAKDSFLSVGRFSHLFKESVGISPMRYITELRIKRAKELLTETEMSVVEIGAVIGFGDQNYFSRIFRKYTGVSPVSYRKSSSDFHK